MLTGIYKFNRNVWDKAKTKMAIALVLIGCLFSLCACVEQKCPTVTPTDAPLPTRAAISTPIPTSTPLPTPPSSTEPGPSSASDLAIQVPEPVQIIPGETTIYTLTIRNLGPDLATSIVLTNVLPAGVIPVWIQSAQPVCGRQERDVRCDLGDLWEGDAVTVTLDLSVGGTETLVTSTRLAGVTLDLPALTCTIEQDATPPRVTCLLDKLQPGADAQTRIGVVADARTKGPLVHTATVAASGTDANSSNNSATFTMTVGASKFKEPAAAFPATTDLVVQADGPASVIAGQPFTYTFAIANRGTQDATGVSFENVLPPATDVDAYAPAVPRCEQRDDAFVCALCDPESGETVTFTLVITGHAGQPMIIEPDALMPGWPICTVLHERTFLHIVNCELGVLKPNQVTHVQTVLTAGGVLERAIVNTASVSANEAELNPLDNTDATTLTVQTRADLTLWSVISGSAVADKTLSYTLAVANVGPSDADGVILTDTLPVGTSSVSVAPGRGDDCRVERDESSTDTVVCSLARLNAGETVTVTIVVAVDESLTASLAEEIFHSASVTAEQADPNPGNNALTEPIPVSAEVED